MNSKLRKGSGFLVILLLISSSTYASQSKDSESKTDDWQLCTICAIPARMALNASPGPSLVPQRHIYLFVEAFDFTEKNLRKAFERLSATYPDPGGFLYITAFSNKAFLKQIIKAEEADVIFDFPDTPEGREAQHKYYSERYPPRKGYFRAYYFRHFDGQESFQYTPDPEDEKTVEIVLKRTNK
jgi:hypothetical protein